MIRFLLVSAQIALRALGRNRLRTTLTMLGVIIGVAAVLIACVSLIADFDFIENAVKNGAPKEIEWKAAFGLILTLVWLYIEFLRIIAILFGRR